MVRTQIYLTEEEQTALRSLSRKTGLTQSELIRQAIDSFLAEETELDRSVLLSQAYGVWKDRSDLPDFEALRREWDRTEAA
jgi:hypothetical protein